MNKYSKVIRLILILFLLTASETAVCNQPDDPVSQIESINQRIKENMQQRNTLIGQEQYEQAEQSTDQILGELDQLIEAFMPLDERIQLLITQEQQIIDQTLQTIEDKPSPDNAAKTKKYQDDLLHNQIVNREKTAQTSQLVERELDKGPSANDNGGSAENRLEEVTQLLKGSVSDQSNAIASLEVSGYQKALSDEQAAIEKLKAALEKLRQQKQSDQQDSGGKNKEQQQQQNSQKQQAPDQQSGQDKKPGETDPKKLTSKEALTELLRLRKKANDEIKRREKEFGEIQIDGRIPVEKDW
jgi:hypothetical protein